MDIRPATSADVPRLVAMGAHFIEATGYRTLLPVNEAQLAALMARLLTEPGGAIFVLATEATVMGAIGLYRFAHPISGEPVASEVFWWVEPDARGSGLRLLREAERWAAAQGAALLQMIAPTPAVERVYAHRGYVPVERLYQRRLDRQAVEGGGS
jgi:GNAT superfamily N-acetyltransferase